MAYPLSLLALINGPTTAAAWQPRSAWPASRSLSAGPAPRYGTCVTVAPISWANSMPHRCANEPTPACATLAFCPGSFSQRTSSAMVLGGRIGLPTTVAALALPEVRDQLREQGAEVVGNSAAELAAYVAAEIPKWAALARQTGVKPL